MAEPLLHFAAPEDEPLVLAGPPGQLTGQVELHNRSNVDVVLRDAGLKDPSGVLTSRRQSFSPLVLKAFQERRVPLTIAVDPSTPPGEYHAELELGGRSRQVLLHVIETYDLSVRPQSLVVVNHLDEPQRKRIVVTNEGNVPFSIGDLGDVDLEDDLVSSRVVRLALEPSTHPPGPSLDPRALAVVMIERRGAFVEDGLSVRKKGDEIELLPGELAVIDLEITLHAELPQGSRYRGRVPLLTRDLEIVVVSSSSAPTGQPTTPPSQTKTAGKDTAAWKKTTKGQGGRR